jgi:EAL domain-containing protein (putative c-di-GMP-specific phosphodiesterase class I)
MEALLRNADNALYRAKNEGRNNFQCYTREVGAAASRRLELETQLGHALEREELSLHYQPQYELERGELVGLEALLRWNHSSLGAVAPTTFIPIAEESGLIIPIGAWVLEEACRQIEAWQQASQAGVRVAVNVSTLQFKRHDFVETVAQALRKASVEPRFLELELTESVVMKNVDQSAPRMATLRALGVGVAIDDFGTGYSSLSYLQRLPIETLKIDQSFVRDMKKTSSTQLLVESVVTLARSLGMNAIAEGVETRSQLKALRAMGCDRVQGFLLGRPLHPEALLPHIATINQCPSLAPDGAVWPKRSYPPRLPVAG